MEKHSSRFSIKDIDSPLFRTLLVLESGDRKSGIETENLKITNGKALGRYQLGEQALQAIGAISKNGNEYDNKDWTGIYGKSREEFLESKKYQEEAIIAYANIIDYKINNNKNSEFIGSFINDHKVTYDGIFLNAYHRPGGLNKLLNEIDQKYKNKNLLVTRLISKSPGSEGLPDFDAHMVAGLEAENEEEKKLSKKFKLKDKIINKLQNYTNENSILEKKSNKNIYYDISKYMYGKDNANNAKKIH